MKYCIKLLPAFLAFGVFSAYADSETDRYMASAGAPAAEIRENDQQSGVSSQEIVLSGPMSPVTAYYVSPCFGPMCDPEPRKCKWYSFCRSSQQCVGPGSSPSSECPCLPNDLGNPRAGGSCQGRP